MQEEDGRKDRMICNVPTRAQKSRTVEEESAEERSWRDRHSVEIHAREGGWIGVDSALIVYCDIE